MLGILVLSLGVADAIEIAEWPAVDLVQVSLENRFESTSRTEVEALAAACERHGKRLAFHAPSKDLNLGSSNEGAQREARRQIEACIRLVGCHAEFMTLHTGFARRYATSMEYERGLKAISELAACARDCGTTLSVENVMEESLEELMDYVRLVEPERINITLDAAHVELYANYSMETALSVLGNRVIDIHVSTPQNGVDAHLPVTSGSGIYRRLCDVVVCARYSRSVTVEARTVKEARDSLHAIVGDTAC